MATTTTKPKHLAHMTDEQFQRLVTGLNRFRFGFAEPGEVLDGCEFVGNFDRKKHAVAARDACQGQGHLNPYLSGRLKVGWAVWKRTAPGPTAGGLNHG